MLKTIRHGVAAAGLIADENGRILRLQSCPAIGFAFIAVDVTAWLLTI
jgi:hypothetical protein